ncbi:MAG: hypothetical protein K6U02_07815 [Firmicutes bacterium]|nr:hypothetical protein [Bacillota bacterium]
MICDLHVHTRHSGLCSVPVLGRFCRESYTDPLELYARLKQLGMDLVTVTDHDTLDAAETLRRFPDFFASEEVTCRMPSGTEIHVGVYDITERQHIALAERRNDLPRLLAYLSEQRLFFSVNHIFSALTGRRALEDFDWIEEFFPALETRNAQMLGPNNLAAAQLARALGKAATAGSDAHTLRSAGSAYTEVPSARNKEEFLAGLRQGLGRAHGQSGGYWKLTRDVFAIAGGMLRERKWTAALLPLAPLVPFVTLANHLVELWFARHWRHRLGDPRRYLHARPPLTPTWDTVRWFEETPA